MGSDAAASNCSRTIDCWLNKIAPPSCNTHARQQAAEMIVRFEKLSCSTVAHVVTRPDAVYSLLGQRQAELLRLEQLSSVDLLSVQMHCFVWKRVPQLNQANWGYKACLGQLKACFKGGSKASLDQPTDCLLQVTLLISKALAAHVLYSSTPCQSSIVRNLTNFLPMLLC